MLNYDADTSAGLIDSKGIKYRDVMDIKFLNVDLEIESKYEPSELINQFGENVIVLHQGESRGYYQAAFEISESTYNADATIDYFCRLIEVLPKDTREYWDSCCHRVFDIGYMNGTNSKSFRSELTPNTIQRIA